MKNTWAQDPARKEAWQVQGIGQWGWKQEVEGGLFL